ncbi:hypothetical protein KCP76_13945 [Salmonella enterica subsp. enterica serovar Weltevreden]|nr:hypothetical protein KCP76_13945 [Salmonella enterica subsp. enterica serovar Weltevreden]
MGGKAGTRANVFSTFSGVPSLFTRHPFIRRHGNKMDAHKERILLSG